MIKYDYQNSIGFIINRIGKSLIYVIDQELRKRFGMTFGQWKVLIILANGDSGLTQKDIADKLVLEGPTLIPIIDKLEKDELVVRKNDPKDRRINRIYLTSKANNLLNDTIQCVAQIKQICIANIAENDVLITKVTLEKMWQNLQSTFNLNCSEENKVRKNLLDDPGPSILVGKN
jgi:MarR family transcriptional regulator for hemolysin